MCLFKTAIDLMPTETHEIVISTDKTPTGEHVRRYNAPTIGEVAIFMVGNHFLPQNIILHKRNSQTLPIIPRSTPSDETNACLKNSLLWAHVKTLKLTINLLFRLQNDDSGEIFSDKLLAIGNRKLPGDSSGQSA